MTEYKFNVGDAVLFDRTLRERVKRNPVSAVVIYRNRTGPYNIPTYGVKPQRGKEVFAIDESQLQHK